MAAHGKRSTRCYGARAEESAAEFLILQGFIILERNWRFRGGEVDIIALEGDVLCFVEVKARRNTRFGHAVEAVDARKQARMTAVASCYLQTHGAERTVRFDVLHRDSEQTGWNLIRDAFRPEAA